MCEKNRFRSPSAPEREGTSAAPRTPCLRLRYRWSHTWRMEILKAAATSTVLRRPYARYVGRCLPPPPPSNSKKHLLSENAHSSFLSPLSSCPLPVLHSFVSCPIPPSPSPSSAAGGHYAQGANGENPQAKKVGGSGGANVQRLGRKERSKVS